MVVLKRTTTRLYVHVRMWSARLVTNSLTRWFRSLTALHSMVRTAGAGGVPHECASPFAAGWTGGGGGAHKAAPHVPQVCRRTSRPGKTDDRRTTDRRQTDDRQTTDRRQTDDRQTDDRRQRHSLPAWIRGGMGNHVGGLTLNEPPNTTIWCPNQSPLIGPV